MIMFQELISGIVGGLISTFLVVVFGIIWSKTLVPWFEERVYQAVHVEGDWFGEIAYDDGNTEKFGFNIIRQSYRISGRMRSLHDLTEYNISGEFKNNLMTLTYRSTVTSAIDRGCFTLILTKNGKEMHGYASYYYSNNYTIKVAPIKLERNDRVHKDLPDNIIHNQDDPQLTSN